MSIEEWEAEAEEFHKQIGYLRPGKDQRSDFPTDEQRYTAFEVWQIMRQKVADARRSALEEAATIIAIRALIPAPPETT